MDEAFESATPARRDMELPRARAAWRGRRGAGGRAGATGLCSPRPVARGLSAVYTAALVRGKRARRGVLGVP
eukprot:6301646-Pyramimonas_sp.AAC.1